MPSAYAMTTRRPDPAAADRAPDQPQVLPPDADTTNETVATPEPEGTRVAEAGSAYTGRQMDDRLKSSPRVRGDGEV